MVRTVTRPDIPTQQRRPHAAGLAGLAGCPALGCAACPAASACSAAGSSPALGCGECSSRRPRMGEIDLSSIGLGSVSLVTVALVAALAWIIIQNTLLSDKSRARRQALRDASSQYKTRRASIRKEYA